MQFDWDNKKSASNKLKHGIDFEDAKKLWNDHSRIEIQASFPDEERFILIGKIKSKIWTAVYTIRDESVRIISVRRARNKEASLYGQK
jgi:uncharacterized DUF497 family protein